MCTGNGLVCVCVSYRVRKSLQRRFRGINTVGNGVSVDALIFVERENFENEYLRRRREELKVERSKGWRNCSTPISQKLLVGTLHKAVSFFFQFAEVIFPIEVLNQCENGRRAKYG